MHFGILHSSYYVKSAATARQASPCDSHSTPWLIKRELKMTSQIHAENV